MVMIGSCKRYIGTYKSAEEAARAFDKHSLWFRGLKVGENRPGTFGWNKLFLHEGRDNATPEGRKGTHIRMNETL